MVDGWLLDICTMYQAKDGRVLPVKAILYEIPLRNKAWNAIMPRKSLPKGFGWYFGATFAMTILVCYGFRWIFYGWVCFLMRSERGCWIPVSWRRLRRDCVVMVSSMRLLDAMASKLRSDVLDWRMLTQQASKIRSIHTCNIWSQCEDVFGCCWGALSQLEGLIALVVSWEVYSYKPERVLLGILSIFWWRGIFSNVAEGSDRILSYLMLLNVLMWMRILKYAQILKQHLWLSLTRFSQSTCFVFMVDRLRWALLLSCSIRGTNDIFYSIVDRKKRYVCDTAASMWVSSHCSESVFPP